MIKKSLMFSQNYCNFCPRKIHLFYCHSWKRISILDIPDCGQSIKGMLTHVKIVDNMPSTQFLPDCCQSDTCGVLKDRRYFLIPWVKGNSIFSIDFPKIIVIFSSQNAFVRFLFIRENFLLEYSWLQSINKKYAYSCENSHARNFYLIAVNQTPWEF